jgi:hypothetical protein
VQNLLLTKDKKIVVIVHVASGIFVRRPGHQNCRKINSSTISEVIESLDNEVGLEMPIFLFGYSKMRRCISQRSSKRVPTHMLLSLGKGHNVENFVQALGRGTFNGRESVLGANGHDNVTVLLDEQDFIAAQKYVKFFDHFVDRIKAGDKTEDALSRTSGRFPDSTNFFRHSERKIGLRKDFRARLEDMDGMPLRSLKMVTTKSVWVCKEILCLKRSMQQMFSPSASFLLCRIKPSDQRKSTSP